MMCKLCQKEFESLPGLHRHLGRGHQISQEEYYHKFFPRYDKHTGQLIIYKDYKQYHESDFNNRESFVAWLSENKTDTKAIDYCWQKVKERMTKKMVTTLPSQVELKGILLPAISGFEKIYGSIQRFIEESKRHGVRLKFDYMAQPTFKDGPITIFCDTREQEPLSFSCATQKMKLSTGDYTCDAPFFSDVFVERKSLEDLAGTLGKGRERFERELIRTKELGFYLVVVVEKLYIDVLNYSPANSFSRKTNGKHIMNQVRQIMTDHDNVQFVFAGNRTRSAEIIEKIFRLEKQVNFLDLEFLKDTHKI